MPVKAVFLDTGFAIALAAPRDRYHARAVQLADELKASGSAIITTRAVLLEIGAALAKVSYRGAAISIIEILENDPDVEIAPLQDGLLKHSRNTTGIVRKWKSITHPASPRRIA